MTRDEMAAQLRATHATLQAALVQVGAMIIALEGPGEGDDDEPGQICPRCGGGDLAEAGDVQVCAKCGANVRDGDVVGG